MGFSGAPVRQPVPDLSDGDFLGAPALPDDPQTGPNSVLMLRLFWDNRKSMLRVGIYALLASIFVAFLIPARYESTARLMPPDNQPSLNLSTAVATMTGSAGPLGGLAGNFLGLKSTSDLFAAILSSRTVQDKLIQQFDLKKLYGDGRMEDARRDLAEHTGVVVDRKNQIITITVADRDPRRAAALGQAYIEELNRLVAELSTSSARRERIFLEERLQVVNQDLQSAEKDFSQYSSKNTTIDIKEQGKAMVEAAAILQGQLIATESEYQGLRQIYTDSNVRVRSVKARINELKFQFEKLGGQNEGSTTESGHPNDSIYPSFRKLPLLGVTYADLYRRTRVEEAVLESLTKEYEMAKVQEVKEIPVVKVLDSPSISDKKSFPPRLLIMFLGTAIALALATTWMFGRTSWDHTDSGDPRKVFALEVFNAVQASLPKFARNGSRNHPVDGESIKWIPRRQDEGEAPR